MSAITLKVNGKTHALDVDPTTPLLYVLSDDLDLRGRELFHPIRLALAGRADGKRVSGLVRAALQG